MHCTIGRAVSQFPVKRSKMVTIILTVETKMNIWRVPFRLIDIPFFNTSYLCDPNEITNYTELYESDTEPWDAPMRRKKNVSSEIRSQMYGYGRRQSNIDVYISADDDVLVNAPFTRDPSIPMRKFAPRNYEYSPQHRSKSPASPISNHSRYTPPPFCHSPTPYCKPNVNSMRTKFDGNEAVMVYKKRAPRPPSEPCYPEPVRRSSKKKPAPQPQPQPRRNSPTPDWARQVNPIKELEALGKNRSPSLDDDNPPFNFQGMLRKTKYNRDSMKRTRDENRFSLPAEDFENNNDTGN
jgi:myosin-3